MGIDIGGGMIVGSNLEGISVEGDYYSKFYEKGLVVMHSYYDATDKFAVFVGFSVDNIKVEDIDQKWLDSIREKALLFKQITGKDAELIGMQDIT